MFFPNLEELRYNFDLNYAADCVFVGLPRVPSSSFHSVNYGDWEYFKAFTNDSLRWHYPTAIVIVSLPALLFVALCLDVYQRNASSPSASKTILLPIIPLPVTTIILIRIIKRSVLMTWCGYGNRASRASRISQYLHRLHTNRKGVSFICGTNLIMPRIYYFYVCTAFEAAMKYTLGIHQSLQLGAYLLLYIVQRQRSTTTSATTSHDYAHYFNRIDTAIFEIGRNQLEINAKRLGAWISARCSSAHGT